MIRIIVLVGNANLSSFSSASSTNALQRNINQAGQQSGGQGQNNNNTNELSSSSVDLHDNIVSTDEASV